MQRSPFVVGLFVASALGGQPAAELVPAPGDPLPAVAARPLRDVVFERTPERVERGRYLADAVIGCVVCHSERDPALPGAPPRPGLEYAGAIMAEEEGYRLVAPNLTPDAETGAGTWTDDMLARAIREGVGHDGRGIGGQMWWWSFRLLSDEDLASIVVYLRSRPAVRHPLPRRLLSPELEKARAEQAEPLTAPVEARDLSDPLERARYLLEVADCGGCHSAWEAQANPGLFGGGNGIHRLGQTIYSRNITPDPSGIGAWSEATFVGALRDGRGGLLHAAMPWVAYRGMTDADLGAMYRLLRLAEPVRHFVDNLTPPTACAVCGAQHGLGSLNVALDLERERVAIDLGPLEAYVGQFRIHDFVIIITARDGALFASEDGGPEIRLVPVAGGRFRGHGLVAPIGFERDADGNVVALLAYELGATRAEKVGPVVP